MKKIISICSLIGVISLGSLAANAQPSANRPDSGRGPQHEHKFDAADRAAHLQKSLQLSDEQAAKVKKLLEDSEQKDKAIVEQYKPQLDAFHGDIKKLHEQTQTQLNGILTPKQQEALKAQREGHRGWGHRNGKRGFHGDQRHDHDHNGDASTKDTSAKNTSAKTAPR